MQIASCPMEAWSLCLTFFVRSMEDRVGTYQVTVCCRNQTKIKKKVPDEKSNLVVKSDKILARTIPTPLINFQKNSAYVPNGAKRQPTVMMMMCYEESTSLASLAERLIIFFAHENYSPDNTCFEYVRSLLYAVVTTLMRIFHRSQPCMLLENYYC